MGVACVPMATLLILLVIYNFTQMLMCVVYINS